MSISSEFPGIPSSLSAAFVWHLNGLIYFVKGKVKSFTKMYTYYVNVTQDDNNNNNNDIINMTATYVSQF